MSTVLIAGCGDVGNALGRRLLQGGHEVYGLRRNVAALSAGIKPVAADLVKGAGLNAAPREVDAIVYCAAADARTPDGYRAAYIDGVKVLATRYAHQPRWVFVSSTAVYGQCDGSWVDETSPTQPERFNGAVMRDAEQLVLSFGSHNCVVRFGGIYGPGRGQLIERVRSGRPCVETPVQYTNRIHRDDCAGVLAHVLASDEPASVYLGVDCEPAPSHVVQDWIAERIGVPVPPRRQGDPGAGGPGSKRCSNAQLLQSGYEFFYPDFRAGYGALLASAAALSGDAADDD
jgi:nucleoside-diphosphate-sugar epimerase